jgi:hypothetical protein
VITIPLMKSNGFKATIRRRRGGGGLDRRADDAADHGRRRLRDGELHRDPLFDHRYALDRPAILYFLSVAFIVRIEAVKYHVGEGIDLVINKGKLFPAALFSCCRWR